MRTAGEGSVIGDEELAILQGAAHYARKLGLTEQQFVDRARESQIEQGCDEAEQRRLEPIVRLAYQRAGDGAD